VWDRPSANLSLQINDKNFRAELVILTFLVHGCLCILGVTKKIYTHFKRHVDTLVNVVLAVVRRNQKCLDADGYHFEHVKRDLYSPLAIGIY
jgi:hypothetical protein